MNRDNEDL